MITRRLKSAISARLSHMPAVAILGPRQVGKTTLARVVAASRKSVHLDMELPSDRAKLNDPVLFLSALQNKLVVIDELQRMPDLFLPLRGLIDQGRQRGRRSGRFLLLGSASAELLRQSESLAGRIAYIELNPFDVLETADRPMRTLWVRGGFPDSYLARSDAASMRWRQAFIRTYLERDLPQLGPRIPAAALLRFWTMLGHLQGTLLNAAQLGRNLALDAKTVLRYLDTMVDLMLVRRLQPYATNAKKRLVRSPKVYVRDSGIVHALLGLGDFESLMGSPVVGNSWEGFVIENLVAVAPDNTLPYFYRTSNGAEVDLVLEMPGHGLWAIEVKLGTEPKVTKGFHEACADLQPARRFVVYSGTERYRMTTDTEAIGVHEMASVLAGLSRKRKPRTAAKA